MASRQAGRPGPAGSPPFENVAYLCAMRAEFEAHVRDSFPEFFGKRLLLACSAGLDSTVLAHLLAGLGLDMQLAHANFNLRGRESEEDQIFVANLATCLKSKFHVKSFDTIGYVNKNKVSIQMAARDLRYGWFGELLAGGAADLLVTAHHADDTLETFLINLSRGTGLDGISGIPARAGSIRRPLLPFGRDRLEAYARAEGISWREDHTNAELGYLRNRFRHQVVPALKGACPDILERLGQTQENLRESRSLIDTYMAEVRSRVSRGEGSVTRFDCEALRGLGSLKAHLFELFREYGFTDWRAVVSLLEGETGREVRSATHRLLRDRDSLLLRQIEAPHAPWFPVPLDGKAASLPIGLQIEKTDQIRETSPRILYIDKETLKGGLHLRKWRKGDYFYPLGMGGRKLVSKYFKDAAMSRFEKEAQWLLCSGDEIVWVVGRRADDRFKVSGQTREIVKITWED